jgi:Plasmid pRiA4b ORF-3-like protein
MTGPTDLEQEIRARYAAGAAPKAIARALGVRPAVVIPIVRRAAGERGAARLQAVYELKVTLEGTSPPVWRRLRVPCQISLADLHLVLQAVMGWENDHLYEFEVGKRRIGEPSRDGGNRREDASHIQLRHVAARRGARLTYVYDFGDDWQHELIVEKTACPDAEPGKAVCIAGERACPPEDCGGIWGYAELLDALDDPANPHLTERVEWLQDVHGSFDPEHFELDAINVWLDHLKLLRPDPLIR